MYNFLSQQHEFETTDWMAFSAYAPVVENVKRVTFKTFDQLKKMARETLDNLHARMFGAYNPYGDRYEIMWLINNAMTKIAIQCIEALAGHTSNLYEGISSTLQTMSINAMKDMKEGIQHRNIETPAHVETELDVLFAAFELPVEPTVDVPVVPVNLVEENIVYIVLELLRQGYSCADIGKMEMGVSAKQASRIKRGKRYAGLTGREMQQTLHRVQSFEITMEA